MKRIFPLVIAVSLAGCASESTTSTSTVVVSSAPRYATAEEVTRLNQEARVNFERYRQEQGVPAIASGPANGQANAGGMVVVSTERPRPVATRVTVATSRRAWSMAEARYAMEIGKHPSDLTAGERAVARGY